jgi:hypothetical protein
MGNGELGIGNWELNMIKKNNKLRNHPLKNEPFLMNNSLFGVLQVPRIDLFLIVL